MKSHFAENPFGKLWNASEGTPDFPIGTEFRKFLHTFYRLSPFQILFRAESSDERKGLKIEHFNNKWNFVRLVGIECFHSCDQ